ncbi:unnamed protein product [Brassicogethes aeneus]|uniref:Carbonic anhydrase n=1 Tax=Brassicogethes aeneus TaxID=1431903 RepID=A0A9P0AQ84_BRAAE|nr:unnamed protein product [Brassicogethes aeneus]
MTLEWGYSENNGPNTWSNNYPEAAGPNQSPVNISSLDIKEIKAHKKLTWKYIAENTEYVMNPGYCWKVHVEGKGSDLSGGPLNGHYMIEQFHCHWGATDDQGSEHTINGKQYAGELHLVHWNTTKYGSFSEAAKHPDGLCVLGVFLKAGRKNQELDKIVRQLEQIQFKDQKVKLSSPLNPGSLLPEDSGYYTYQGSLTTPPCSECVIWIVFKEPIEVSHEQLQAFRNLKSYCKEGQCPCDDYKGHVQNNFRPTLPLGQREIKECIP